MLEGVSDTLRPVRTVVEWRRCKSCGTWTRAYLCDACAWEIEVEKRREHWEEDQY